jgi:hypothetical protein
MKRMLFVLFFDLLTSVLIGQNDYFNTQKYWKLRSRLHEDFVSMGEDHGQSLVAMIGNKTDLMYDTHYDYSIGGGDILLNHGWYLAVLATERFLLKNHNLSTEKTDHELYLALKTLDRLDMFAEDLSNRNFNYYWDENTKEYYANPKPLGELKPEGQNEFPPGQTVPWTNFGQEVINPNGFMLRDDFPPDFHEYFNGKYEKSFFDCAKEPENRQCDEMSQDQLIHLLMGLKYVVQYVSQDLVIDGQNLVQKAAIHAYNLYMQYYWHNNPNLGIGVKMINPATYEKVPRGGDSEPFIYPISITVASILYDAYNVLPNDLLANFSLHLATNTNPVHVSIWSSLFILGGWSSWAQWVIDLLGSDGTAGNNSVNLHMALCLAATSNTWSTLIPLGAVPGFDYSKMKLYHWGNDDRQKEIYTLIAQSFWGLGQNNWFQPSEIKDLLNSMCCEGPYRYYISNNLDSRIACSDDWDRTNRWVDYSYLYFNPSHSYLFGGEYPGMDYMLLHNLFYIVHNNESQAQFENFKDMHILFQYPRFDDLYLGFTGQQALAHGNGNTIQNFIDYGNDWAYPVIGSHSNPIFFRAFDNIKFTNKVTWNGSVTAHAGKSITWEPGFEVETGGYYEGYVTPIECNSLYGYHRVSNQDSLWNENILPLKQANFIQEGKKFDMPTLPTQNNATLPISLALPIAVYPNPANEKITLLIPNNSDLELSIEIVDVQGKICNKQTAKMQDSKIMLNISFLNEGLYFIIASTNNQVYRTKFQKINY